MSENTYSAASGTTTDYTTWVLRYQSAMDYQQNRNYVYGEWKPYRSSYPSERDEVLDKLFQWED